MDDNLVCQNKKEIALSDLPEVYSGRFIRMSVGGITEHQVSNSHLYYHCLPVTSIHQMTNAALVCIISRSTKTDALCLMNLLFSICDILVPILSITPTWE